jgi:hypothetical protein
MTKSSLGISVLLLSLAGTGFSEAKDAVATLQIEQTISALKQSADADSLAAGLTLLHESKALDNALLSILTIYGLENLRAKHR